MNKIFSIIGLLILLSAGLFATVLNEGFEGTAFPPAGWKVINAGDPNFAWQRSTEYKRTGVACATIRYSDEFTNDDWLISPRITPTTGNVQFRFWAKEQWATYVDQFNVKLSTGGNNSEDFTVSLATGINTTTTYTQYSYDLTPYIGQNVYIAIQSTSFNQHTLCVDDVTGPTLTDFEGFETGNFNANWWENTSPLPWLIQSADKLSGSYAVKSGAISNDGNTSFSINQTITQAGEIRFAQKVSSEASYDFLKFYIDGQAQGAWSGLGSWSIQSYPVSPGNHTFTWEYTKDQSLYGGSDCAWIDDIFFAANALGSIIQPFPITNFDQLNRVRNYTGNSHTGKYFQLMNDIDASPTLTNNWAPVGDLSNYFYGNLDGNNYTISNLRSWYYGVNHGLFGCTAVSSMVKNLTLASTCSFLGDTPTGSIVGRNYGTIQNCQSAATINIGRSEAGGGIVGANNGTVTGCRFTGTITRSGSDVACHKIGGIAGNNETGALIENSFSTGSVSGNNWVGGIAGLNSGTINRCYSSGTVNGAGNVAGGIAGDHYGIITNSYSRANVSGGAYVGGLVGYTGTCTITNSYSTGTVTSGGQKGGLCGEAGGTITNSYWDTQTSGMATSYGGTGKTTTEMKTQSTFTAWDFVGESTNGTSDYWNISSIDNNGYPHLNWEHSSEFRNPIIISPANAVTGLPRGGFNLVWTPSMVGGPLPDYYNIYMRKGSPEHIFELGYPDQHYFFNVTSTSFNPVTDGDLTFAYEDVWYWAVVAATNSNGQASPYPVPQSFGIEADVILADGFETGNVGGYHAPTGWTMTTFNAESSSWQVVENAYGYGTEPRTGSWNVYIHSWGNSWLLHPITVNAGVSYDVELYARQDNTDFSFANVGLYLGTEISLAAMNVITPQAAVTSGDYQRIAGTFIPAASGTYYLGIHAHVDAPALFFTMDDIKVSHSLTPPVRPNPVVQVSPNHLATGLGSRPTLTWRADFNAGIPTSYKLYCQAGSSPLNPTTLVANLNAVSYTFPTELSFNTTYYWKVVATNLAGDALSSTVRAFTTMPDNAVASLLETFGSIGTPFPPTNWYRYNGILANPSTLVERTYIWLPEDWCNLQTPPDNQSANIAISNTDRYDWFVSPRVIMGGAGMRLDLDLALTNNNSSNPTDGGGVDDRFIILIGDGNSWSEANILREWNNTGSPYVFNQIPNTGIHVSIPIGAYTGVKYIAFYGESTVRNSFNDIFVDNVHVYMPVANDLVLTSLTGAALGFSGTPVTHSVIITNDGSATQSNFTVNLKCAAPVQTLASLVVPSIAPGSSTTVNFIWTPSTPLGVVNLFAEVVLAADGNPANNVSAYLDYQGVAANALYEGFESGSIPANWTIINVGNTNRYWEVAVLKPHTGMYSAYCQWENTPNLHNNDWLVTPPLQLSSAPGDQISFWLRTWDYNYSDPWEVLISTTNTNPASFTMIDSGTGYMNAYEKKTYNLDNYGNAVVYVAVRSTGLNNHHVIVDDFIGPPVYNISAAVPVCSLAYNGSNVVLSWNEVLYATEYHVYISPDPNSFPSSYTVVSAPTRSFTYTQAGNAKMFFKVVAVQ